MPRQRENELLFLSVTGRTISLSSKFFSCLFIFFDGVEGGALHVGKKKRQQCNNKIPSHRC